MESIGPWWRQRRDCFIYVQENNKNLQITNFAGLRSVIWAGKTLEHSELQLICVTWQRLPGSVKYLSVYFFQSAAIYSLHGPALRSACKYPTKHTQTCTRAHARAETHTHISCVRLVCPWWKWLHASLIPAAHLYSQQPTFNIEVPLS